MQAGLGGASTTAHRAAELPFGVLQAAGALQQPHHHPCTSTVLLLAQLPAASRAVGQGSRELWALNRFLGQSDTKICCFLTALCQLLCCPQSRALHWPCTLQGARREKPWCDIFPGAPVPPALLPPAAGAAGCSSCVLGEDWGLLHQRMEEKWRQRHLSQGTTTTATAEKARQAGLWECSHFLIRKKCWEMFKVSVCLNLTWLKDDES